MMKKKWIYAIGIVIILCVGIFLYITIRHKKQERSTEEREISQNTGWQDFNPLDFKREDVLSITYIKDRSGLGETTNSSWYIDDEIGIQAIMDCIEQDTSYLGDFDRKYNPDGNTVIVLWFELSNGRSKQMIYTDAWLTYDDITYKINSREALLKNADNNILVDYQMTEISGTDNPNGS